MCNCHGIILTKQARTDIAVDELRRKLSLERTFMNELRSLFRRMRDDFRISVAATGSPRSATMYLDAWQSLLFKHYERVQRSFRNEIETQNGFKSYQFKQSDDLEDLVSLALLAWRDDNSQEHARFITQTNHVQMQEAIAQARLQLVEDGEPLTDRNVAAAASAILAVKFGARVGTIANTETQEAAEGTKQIRAEALSGLVPFTVTGQNVPQPTEQREVTKTWQTVGDRRVRSTHVAANGTTIGASDTYNLSGSLLRFPGDSGLGASLAEIINCRCSNRFEVV